MCLDAQVSIIRKILDINDDFLLDTECGSGAECRISHILCNTTFKCEEVTQACREPEDNPGPEPEPTTEAEAEETTGGAVATTEDSETTAEEETTEEQ